MARQRLVTEALKVERLHERHTKLVSDFSCTGREEEDFLKHDALANQNFHLSETYLLFENGRGKIVSYVTLSIGSFKLSPNREIGGVRIGKKPYRINSNNMPCLLIAKLATDRQEEGRGGARHLVSFAIEKALELNGYIAVPFVALDAYGAAVPYYEKLGFKVAFHPAGKNPKTITMYMRLFE